MALEGELECAQGTHLILVLAIEAFQQVYTLTRSVTLAFELTNYVLLLRLLRVKVERAFGEALHPVSGRKTYLLELSVACASDNIAHDFVESPGQTRHFEVSKLFLSH